MSQENKSSASRASVLGVVDQIFLEARRGGHIQQYTEDAAFEDGSVRVNGQRLLNFGSCSYLALERHPALVRAAVDAVLRYGTQFSSSRAYLSLGLYRDVEERLAEITGVPVVLAPTTTLGHLSALPVLISDEDAVLVDHQAHNSMQTSLDVVRAHGTHVELIPHNDLGVLADRAAVLSAKSKSRRVWYVGDGIYSMFGDFAPLGHLGELLETFPRLHVYLDDAHGGGWYGERGRGAVLEHAPASPRVVTALSFAKSFGACGGALVIRDETERRLVQNCGGPMTFSGPIQPATLGALRASLDLHLSGAIAPLQAALVARVATCNRVAAEVGLPLMGAPLVPIKFIPTGRGELAMALGQALRDAGYWINLARFPAVPRTQAGVRFTINAGQSDAEIRDFVATAGDVLRGVLARAGVDAEEVRAAFAPVAGRIGRSPLG